jgi:hypothetical protein
MSDALLVLQETIPDQSTEHKPVGTRTSSKEDISQANGGTLNGGLVNVRCAAGVQA